MSNPSEYLICKYFLKLPRFFEQVKPDIIKRKFRHLTALYLRGVCILYVVLPPTVHNLPAVWVFIFQGWIDTFHYVTFFLHFSLITVEMILSFICDYPNYHSTHSHENLVDERQPLLTKNEPSRAPSNSRPGRVKIAVRQLFFVLRLNILLKNIFSNYKYCNN